MPDPDRAKSDQEPPRQRARLKPTRPPHERTRAPVHVPGTRHAADDVRAAGDGATTNPTDPSPDKGAAARPRQDYGRPIDFDLGVGDVTEAAPERPASAGDGEGGGRIVSPPRRGGPRVQPDLFGFQQLQGKHP